MSAAAIHNFSRSSARARFMRGVIFDDDVSSDETTCDYAADRPDRTFGPGWRFEVVTERGSAQYRLCRDMICATIAAQNGARVRMTPYYDPHGRRIWEVNGHLRRFQVEEDAFLPDQEPYDTILPPLPESLIGEGPWRRARYLRGVRDGMFSRGYALIVLREEVGLDGLDLSFDARFDHLAGLPGVKTYRREYHLVGYTFGVAIHALMGRDRRWRALVGTEKGEGVHIDRAISDLARIPKELLAEWAEKHKFDGTIATADLAYEVRQRAAIRDRLEKLKKERG